jgi:hypothetical protein
MRVFLLVVATVLLVALLATPAFAGQPNKSCEDPGASPTPGFSTGGFENAEAHYAGSEDNPNRGNQDKAVSQYDVACFRGPQR